MKLFSLVLSVLLATLSLRCAPDEADWYGDERFSEEERAEIERGARWLHAQAELPEPTFRWGMKFEGREAQVKTIRREVGPSGATGECVGGHLGVVYLSMDGAPKYRGGPVLRSQMAGFAAHELAHCTLGFEDRYFDGQEKSEGIMRVLDPMIWSASEEAQCRAHADLCPSGKAAEVATGI